MTTEQINENIATQIAAIYADWGTEMYDLIKSYQCDWEINGLVPEDFDPSSVNLETVWQMVKKIIAEKY
tara:strand:+ start:428 stop:634 length:207 start_codon:yes stop_codon:yes gene_type:complete